MHIKKNYTFREVMFLSGKHFIWLVPYVLLMAVLYRYTPLRSFSIPWLPLSVIGTAVAFYVGFKNNQAYDRLWEARIVWGGIVNSSRSWGSNVKAFLVSDENDPTELAAIKRALVYRHLAWIYKLRSQLLEPTAWEHISLPGLYRKDAEEKKARAGIGLYGRDITNDVLQKYLNAEDYQALPSFKNAATQLMDIQSQELSKLRRAGYFGAFEHVKLQGILDDFYDHQGKAERIKKTPFPRQFGSFGFIMICLFIAMLPFGFFSEFGKMGDYGVWLAIPFLIVISWIYVLMELVGDYSENPFEGLENDVPMLSICRTIEIDLLQQLKDENLPPAIQPINHVLM